MIGSVTYPYQRFVAVISLLFLLGWLGGCMVPTPPVAQQPESAVVPTVESSPVAEATLPPPVEAEAQAPARCTQAMTTFNVRTELGLAGLVQVAYRDETTVEIAGWGQSSDTDPPFNRFRRHALNLDTGSFTPVAPPAFPSDLTTCTDCITEVLEVLPDGETALVAIQGDDALEGLWLQRGAEAEVTRLVSFIPYDSVWGYSDDGTLLWLDYSLPEYGRDLILVYPAEPAAMVQPTSEELDPTRYQLAFSPVDQTMLSYPLPDENPEAPPEIATYDVRLNPAVLQNRERREAVVRVLWDGATEMYLVVEEAGEEVIVTTLTGQSRIVIPLAALQQMNDNIDGVAEWRTAFTASATFALAPDDSSFVIADGRGRVTVFGCERDS